jgi:hypothetical protein
MRKANGHPPSVEARYVLAFFQKLTSLVGIEACAFASLAARSMIREFRDAIPGQWLISSLGSFFACLMSAGTVCVSLLATSPTPKPCQDAGQPLSLSVLAAIARHANDFFWLGLTTVTHLFRQ